MFDQAVNSLCVVSLIFVKPQTKKKQETGRVQEKREFASLGQGLLSLKGNYMYLMWTPACGLCHSYSLLFFHGARHRLLTGAAHLFCSICTFATACGFARWRLMRRSPYVQNNCHLAKKLPLFLGILWSCTGLECANGGSLSSDHPAHCMAFGLILKFLLWRRPAWICGHIQFHLFYFIEAHQGILSCRVNILMPICLSNLAELLSLIGFSYVSLLDVTKCHCLNTHHRWFHWKCTLHLQTEWFYRNRITEKPARISFEWM